MHHVHTFITPFAASCFVLLCARQVQASTPETCASLAERLDSFPKILSESCSGAHSPDIQGWCSWRPMSEAKARASRAVVHDSIDRVVRPSFPENAWTITSLIFGTKTTTIRASGERRHLLIAEDVVRSDALTLTIKELGGKRNTRVLACALDLESGLAARVGSLELNATLDSKRDEHEVLSLKLNGVRGKIVVLLVEPPRTSTLYFHADVIAR